MSPFTFSTRCFLFAHWSSTIFPLSGLRQDWALHWKHQHRRDQVHSHLQRGYKGRGFWWRSDAWWKLKSYKTHDVTVAYKLGKGKIHAIRSWSEFGKNVFCLDVCVFNESIRLHKHHPPAEDHPWRVKHLVEWPWTTVLDRWWKAGGGGQGPLLGNSNPNRAVGMYALQSVQIWALCCP